MGRRVDEWNSFAAKVEEHIAKTESGHYSARIDVIDFIEGYFDAQSAIAWIKDAIKYLARVPRTSNPVDLLKSAHYVQRIYTVLFERPTE